jgi:hypothetical protein
MGRTQPLPECPEPDARTTGGKPLRLLQIKMRRNRPSVGTMSENATASYSASLLRGRLIALAGGLLALVAVLVEEVQWPPELTGHWRLLAFIGLSVGGCGATRIADAVRQRRIDEALGDDP